MKFYDKQIEERMKYFYSSLNEKDQRHYAALEAEKLGHGGITYISGLFGCSRQTLYAGIDELEKKLFRSITNSACRWW